MVKELLHYFSCFGCKCSFAIARVKGRSKYVSDVVPTAKYCSRTPADFTPSPNTSPVSAVGGEGASLKKGTSK